MSLSAFSDLLPILNSIVNFALQSGIMPNLLKNALVTPVLKKSQDKENLVNYRPVSNLPYLGKLVEKVAVKQLDAHMTDENLHEPLQSAYRSNHSTETALVKVSNDILSALDERKCVYLVLLDLSAAFDTIDHTVFLQRLEGECGVAGDALKWMESYLSDRHQCVKINSTLSDNRNILFGFPQGSLIGPFGFKIYTKPLTEIAKRHNIKIHLYADDTQLYTSFDPNHSEEAMNRLESCIEDIRNWMSKNFLKLNEKKTEFIIFGTKTDLSKIEEWTVTVGDSIILPSKSVRNIGARMDTELTLNDHINDKIRACYAQLYSISKIRKYLSIDSTKSIVHAFVISRFDNLNSLLANSFQYQYNRLQKVQNNAARLITKQKKSDHITPTLQSLHWLPIEQRIQYKILLLVFKCHLNIAPSYLQSLLIPYTPNHYNLRSAMENKYCVNRTKKKYGELAYMNAGPKLWNELPASLRNCPSISSFKTKLKTHLFEIAFGI